MLKPAKLGPLPESYTVEFYFASAGRAREAAFYPGAEAVDERIVRYQTDSIQDLLVAKMFMTEI